jgi:hypothetical protein
MDFEYDVRHKTPSVFDTPEKETLITEKTEIESGVKRKCPKSIASNAVHTYIDEYSIQ